MRILVGVDGSAGALEATRQAAELCGGRDDRLALFYAPAEFHAPAGSTLEPELLLRSREALSRVVFEAALAAVPQSQRGQVETITGTQQARTGLLAAAEEWHADLIAVGARGLGPISRMLLGSVSRWVVHQASLPVLVARPSSQRTAGAPLGVLLGLEASDADQTLIDLVNRITWPAGAEGRLISVVESMSPAEMPDWLTHKVRSPEVEAMSQVWVQEHHRIREETQHTLLTRRAQLPAAFRQGEPIIAEGHPAEQILGSCERLGSNLLVVGARGMGMLERLLVGSTSEKLLAWAPCSVLVARQKPTG